MKTNKPKNANRNASQEKQRNSQMKEEISMEIAEMGNLTPKQEPMTPNQREKSESEKWYP